jgi:isopentenyl diphosphate isomerase/L-lactate dehydrogenase-like FMN-dependent dehydrogenase
MAKDFVCTHEIIEAAHRSWSGSTWDYVAGAALTETTLRRNRYALDSLAFLPRVLRDVSNIDMTATVLGRKLRTPVVIQPMGSLNLMTAEGGRAIARAATRYGTLQTVSSVAGQTLESIAEASDCPKVFQLYVRGDMDWIKGHLDRAQKAGYVGLMLTVDGPYYGIRERQLIHRWSLPSVDDPNRKVQASVTWDTFAEMRKHWGGPTVIKGIATAADARLAIEHGVDAICVSNHGGRELDHGRGTLDMLPEIVETASKSAEVWVDGGFVRGTDVVKALCLGATCVGIGRLAAWGLGADGEDGLVRTLELLEAEIFNAMGLIGATSVAGLSPDYLTRVVPMGPTHETSAFRHLGPEPLR